MTKSPEGKRRPIWWPCVVASPGGEANQRAVADVANESAPKCCSRRVLLAEADVAGEDPSCNGRTLVSGAGVTGREALGPAGVGVDGTLGRDSSESLEGLAGRLGATCTAKARGISGPAVKSLCACETGGWGRLSDEGPRQKNSDLSEGPWGREASSSRTAGRARPTAGTQRPDNRHVSEARPKNVANLVEVGVCQERLKPIEAWAGRT